MVLRRIFAPTREEVTGKSVLTLRNDKLHNFQCCPMYLVKHNTIKTCQAAAEQLLYAFLTWTQKEVNCRVEGPASLPPLGSGQELGRLQSRSEYSSEIRVPLGTRIFLQLARSFFTDFAILNVFN
jgi:hypothetical protein